MKSIYIVFTLIISYGNILSQDFGENYMLFSNSKKGSEYIEFKNDSILIRKPYYSIYEENSVYKEYKYKRENDIITIHLFDNSEDVEYKIINNHCFENSEKEEVYVKRSFFEKNPSPALIYKQRTYWLNTPNADSILSDVDTSKVSINIYKKYAAFKKLGYEYVFGIVEIIDK